MLASKISRFMVDTLSQSADRELMTIRASYSCAQQLITNKLCILDSTDSPGLATPLLCALGAGLFS